jgi:hypothetical protein
MAQACQPLGRLLVLVAGVFAATCLVSSSDAHGDDRVSSRRVVPEDASTPPADRLARREAAIDSEGNGLLRTSEPIAYSIPEPQPLLPEQSLLQRAFVRSTFDMSHIPGSTREPNRSIEMTDISLATSIALPGSTVDSAFLVTPGMTARFWEGPTTLDLPSDLYDTWVDLTWRAMLTERWLLNAGVAGGVYTDFEQWDSDAIRITGRVISTYEYTPEFAISVGFVYLDREDFPALPVAGFMWKPHDWLEVDAMFPKPRVAIRALNECDHQVWLYAGGELGGGQWLIEQPGGTTAELTYNDYRFLLGFENRLGPRFRGNAEFGWTFWREIELEGVVDDFKLVDAPFVRLSLIY